MQPYAMLCAIIGGYIFSCLSGNPPYLMLCATLTYALCYFCGAIYILNAEWECSVQPAYPMLCAIFLWVYNLKPEWESLPYAVCNLNLCFVLFFVGLYIFSRLSGNALCNLTLCFVQLSVGIYSQA